MKRKFLLSGIALLLGVVFLSMSACGAKASLSFTSDWNGNNVQIGYKETAVYKVEHLESYKLENYDYTTTQAVKDAVDMKFTDGVYTVTTKIEPKSNIPAKYTGDIVDSSVESVLHITTEYSVKSHYKYGTKTEHDVYDDFVKTDAYFCLSNASYTPIYVLQENKYALLSVSNGVAEVSTTHFKREFMYSKEKYVINKLNVDTDKVTDYTEYKKYQFKTAIDNSELLFALRNVKIAEVDGTYTLPTITATYGTAMDLLVKRHEGATLNVPLTVNAGAEETHAIPTRIYAFSLNNNLTKGKTQIAYIQNKATETLEYKAHLVKYVAPLTAYGSFDDMGVMVYTLSSVTCEVV